MTNNAKLVVIIFDFNNRFVKPYFNVQHIQVSLDEKRKEKNSSRKKERRKEDYTDNNEVRQPSCPA